MKIIGLDQFEDVSEGDKRLYGIQVAMIVSVEEMRGLMNAFIEKSEVGIKLQGTKEERETR